MLLWAALLLGNEFLFTVGLARVVIRDFIDAVACYLDGKYLRFPRFLVFTNLAGITLFSYSVFSSLNWLHCWQHNFIPLVPLESVIDVVYSQVCQMVFRPRVLLP